MLLIFKFAVKQFLTLQSLPVRLHIGFFHIGKKTCAYVEIVLDMYLFIYFLTGRVHILLGRPQRWERTTSMEKHSLKKGKKKYDHQKC